MQQDAIVSSQDSIILQCCLILSKWPVLMFEMKNHHYLPCAGAVVQFPGNGEEYITYTLGGHDHLRWPLTLGEDAPLKRGQLSCTPPKMYHVTKGTPVMIRHHVTGCGLGVDHRQNEKARGVVCRHMTPRDSKGITWPHPRTIT